MAPLGGAQQPDQAALREKIYAAERRMAVIRVAIIALNSITYLTVFDRTLGINWLALTIIAAAWAYAVPVAVFEPYRRMAFLMAALFTAVTDALLITFWVISTGGYDSPYYLLWYAAIASIAFRYDYRRTMIAAVVDAALYVAILAALGQLMAHPTEAILRVGYIFIIAALCGEAAREAYKQLRAQVVLRDKMRIVEAAEAKFRAAADNANDAIVSLDEQGNLVYFNPRAEQLFGVEAAAVVGQPMRNLLAPAFRAGWEELRARALAGTLAADPVQLAGLRAGGEEVPLEMSLALWRTDEGAFLTAIARDVTERKRAEAKLEYQSLHDPLTGLPNRVLLHDRLQTAINAAGRDDSRVAFLLLDLDYFKDVNDTFGHDWGDRVLEGAADRLRATVRDSDTVARLGGDEFGVVLTNLRSIDDSAAVARKILHALERPFAIDAQTAAISASIGMVVAPDHGRDVDMLMQRADVAMYTAKGQRNGYALYEARQDNASAERLGLAADLKQAMQLGELSLEFQPQVGFAPGTLLEVEAQLRWRHPVHGLVEPEKFVPLAERAGLINELTDWGIDGAAAQARIWLNAGREIPVAVRISARSLHDPKLRLRVQRTLRRHDVPPRLLKLELTERTVMAHGGRELDTLTDLSALGVVLGINGFGAGYSSLAQLKQLPIAQLTIDQSFTRNVLDDEKDAAIVRSIIDLGHNLGMTVIAEGIDDPTLADKVGLLGCDRGQGYYFGRPMAADQLNEWLATSPWANPGAERPASREPRRPALKLA
ncbi:MAG TPA: EAL domain-containing protein [Chloroflexota bacterium]|nr:EAL domain-containing protein [Chloroflexota bacterium]